MKQPVFLRIFNGDKLEGVKQFTETQIVIGKNPGLQLTLADDSVSPLHAVIEERDSGYYLSDLGSSTGTMRNGNKALDEKLANGDELTVGVYKIQFYIGVPKPLTVPPTASKTTPTSVSSPAKTTPVVARPVMGKSSSPGTKKKNRSTFAPPSYYSDASELLKPTKGTVVEVVVAWRERVLSTYHFNEKQMVSIGGDSSCDIVMPISKTLGKLNILRIGTMASALVNSEMTGELYKEGSKIPFSELYRQNRMRGGANGFELDLQQGEMIRIGFMGDLVSVYIRYVPESPKPLMAPLLDLTASEATGVILAAVVTLLFGLYMIIYNPSNLTDEKLLEEPIRKAIVTFNPPPKKVVVEATEAPQEKKVVTAQEKPKKEEKQAVQVTTKPQENAKSAATLPGPQGKAGEVAPKDTTDKTKKLTSAKPGGAIKTAPKEGANLKAEKPDPSKVGLLGVFSNKGTQSKLDKAYSGSGELQGMADSATGFAGQAEDRAGDTIGTKLKDTGAGGKGTATVGISGVGTQGKGGGNSGYGTGGLGGLGKKGSVDINVEGSGAEFSGSIDKEAIRRVIIANKNSIRSCYERVLQRKPDMYGKLVLEWDIEEKGRVSRASVVSNSLGDDDVASCIINRLKTWRFPEPPPDQVGRVTFPFVFTAQ